MSLKERKRSLGIKIEAVEGTAETITGAEVILADNIQFSAETPPLETGHLTTTLSQAEDAPGRIHATISFDVLLYGAAAAGSAPFWGPLLQACGFSETLTGGVSAEYLPSSSAIKSLTIKFFEDGKSYQLTGARGNVSRAANAGEFAVFSFSFTGIHDPVNDADAVKDETLLVGTAFPAFLPKKFQNARFTADSFLAVLESISWDMSNTISIVPDGNVTNYKRIDITERKPAGEFSIEAVLQATKNFEDIVANKTAIAINNTIGGDESGNGTGTLNTMTDATKNWPTDKFTAGFSLLDSANAVFAITDSDATTVTVAGTPASGQYVIYEPGKLTIESMPKAQLQSQNKSANESRVIDGVPFMLKKNSAAGDNEISVKVI